VKHLSRRAPPCYMIQDLMSRRNSAILERMIDEDDALRCSPAKAIYYEKAIHHIAFQIEANGASRSCDRWMFWSRRVRLWRMQSVRSV
jgi:hypothetical protein